MQEVQLKDHRSNEIRKMYSDTNYTVKCISERTDGTRVFVYTYAQHASMRSTVSDSSDQYR